MLRKRASASDVVSSVGQDTQDIDRRERNQLWPSSLRSVLVCAGGIRSEMQCGLSSAGVLQLVRKPYLRVFT